MAFLRGELKRLTTSGALYLVPNILCFAASFILTPLYARAMAVGDYGMLGVATTVAGIGSIVLCLCLHGAVPRLYFEYETEPEKRTFFASLLAFMLVVPTALAGMLHLAGSAGLLDVFSMVRFKSGQTRPCCSSGAMAVFNLSSLGPAYGGTRTRGFRPTRANCMLVCH